MITSQRYIEVEHNIDHEKTTDFLGEDHREDRGRGHLSLFGAINKVVHIHIPLFHL